MNKAVNCSFRPARADGSKPAPKIPEINQGFDARNSRFFKPAKPPEKPAKKLA